VGLVGKKLKAQTSSSVFSGWSACVIKAMTCRNLDKHTYTAFAKDYRAELDISEELGPEDDLYSQSRIGVLTWMVELGRVDIITEVSMFASQMAMPCELVFHVYAFLHNKHNSMMAFDPSYTNTENHLWVGLVKEAIPPNTPLPCSKEVDIQLYVDSDHAGDRLIKRS
jgi:hypothetical protein